MRRQRCGRCRRTVAETYRATGSAPKLCGDCAGRAPSGMCRICFDLPHRRDETCRGCGERYEAERGVPLEFYTGVSSLGEVVKGQWID